MKSIKWNNQLLHTLYWSKLAAASRSFPATAHLSCFSVVLLLVLLYHCGLYVLCGQGMSVCVLCGQGLSILLNTCNLRTADKYTEFADHVTCVSLKREEAVPVVNRRSVCLYVLFSMLVIGQLITFSNFV